MTEDDELVRDIRPFPAEVPGWSVWQLSLAPDGRRLALVVMSNFGRVYFWDVEDGKALGNTVAVGFGGDLFAHGWQVRLAGRVRHVREEFGAFVGQRPTAPEQVPGGAHLGGIDVGLREQTAAEHGSHLVRVDLVRFGFAAMDGLHGESMPEDKRATCVGTPGGQPVPGAQTLDGDH